MAEPIFKYNEPVESHFDTSTERPSRPRRVSTIAPSFPPPPGPTRKIPIEKTQNEQSKTIINLVTEHLSFLVNNPRVLTKEQETFMYEIASSFANTLTEKNYVLSDKEIRMGTSDSNITESENYPKYEINNTDEKNENSNDTFSSESSEDEFKNESIPLISDYDQLRSGSCTPDHSDNYSEQLEQIERLDINFPNGNNWATFESDSTLNDHNNDMDTITMNGTWMDTITAKGTLGNSRDIPSNMAATQTELSFKNAITQTNNSPYNEQQTKSVAVQTNPIKINSPIEVSSPMIHIDNPDLSSDKALEKMCEDFSSMDTSPENAMLSIANRKSDYELRHKPIDEYIDDEIYETLSANEMAKVAKPILLSSKPCQDLEEKKDNIKIKPDIEQDKGKSGQLDKNTTINEEKLGNQHTPKHFFINSF